jgi:hypothetical protein
MARFDLSSYDTVESRIKKFWKLFPDGAIRTALVTTEGDRERKQWIVQAFCFAHRNDEFPIGSGLAFEIDGTAGANQTSALENAETSSIGRCLSAIGLSGNLRPSVTEMEKVARGNVTALPVQKPTIDPQTATNLDDLNKLWADAVATGQSAQLQTAFAMRKVALSE